MNILYVNVRRRLGRYDVTLFSFFGSGKVQHRWVQLKWLMFVKWR
jgi:hypothetical protein